MRFRSVGLLIFLVSATSFADEDPACQNIAIGDTPIVEVLRRSSISKDQKIEALRDSCYELSPSGELAKMPKAEGWMNELSDVFMQALIDLGGLSAGAFSRLSDTEAQRAFMAQLQRIRTVSDPVDRIQQVYELVSAVQGKYDDYYGIKQTIKNGVFFSERPENLLNSATEDGSAGVCRQFAGLLYWSLLQVARGPDGSVFSVDYITGRVPTGPDKTGVHNWVRVHLPKRDPDGHLRFQDFDLDTTWYARTFTPLSPRLIGLSEEEQKASFASCLKASECIEKSETRSQPPASKRYSCGEIGEKSDYCPQAYLPPAIQGDRQKISTSVKFEIRPRDEEPSANPFY